jgi:hypothetical protein
LSVAYDAIDCGDHGDEGELLDGIGGDSCKECSTVLAEWLDDEGVECVDACACEKWDKLGEIGVTCDSVGACV